MDMLLLVGLVGGVGSVVGVVLAQAMQDQRPARALAAADNLAMQIEAHEMVIEKTPQNPRSSDRAPASVQEVEVKLPAFSNDGDLGKDPWGHAYHYAIRKHPDGRASVYVWSDGANGRDESRLSADPTAKLSLGGDDVGQTREFKRL